MTIIEKFKYILIYEIFQNIDMYDKKDPLAIISSYIERPLDYPVGLQDISEDEVIFYILYEHKSHPTNISKKQWNNLKDEFPGFPDIDFETINYWEHKRSKTYWQSNLSFPRLLFYIIATKNGFVLKLLPKDEKVYEFYNIAERSFETLEEVIRFLKNTSKTMQNSYNGIDLNKFMKEVEEVARKSKKS